ncbi:glutathione S-transferase C-terminal domain-containing protein [Propionispira raffinosivorans]|uniref:glutathione S-transferase C-terminal domain-containing protein n=1 Tax=Propionispira raffinosivorans TaxID=86959 RepID=UPI000362264A|nr:glutathione S-transferase C-terminal domain-containing protein [Propionispira raffinosivorans]
MPNHDIARPRPKETENEIDANGAFVRQNNHFTAKFGPQENENPVEANRYRLIWAKGCNWSNRAAIVRELLGIDAISVNLVGRTERTVDLGWEFCYDEKHKDPILDVEFLSELYANADPEYKGRATVPALVDSKTKKVINNDYHKLTNYFEVDFAEFHKENAPDLYPETLRSEIDKFNEWLFHNINNGVYKAAFAQTIGAYNDAFNHFYKGLDELEKRLGKNRFLFGDYVSDSDVRFFVTLARFDISYYRHLGPVRNRIVDFKNIWGYARDLYQIPAFKNNTYFKDLAKQTGNTNTIFVDYNTRFWNQIDFAALWGEPHDRARLSKDPDHKFLISKNKK